MLKKLLKKNKYIYKTLSNLNNFLLKRLNFIFRNRSLFVVKKFSNNNKNIFILDTRIHSIIFDSVMLLIRASNFFYKEKWEVIIYEDDFYRYQHKHVPLEIYFNSLINIFLQSLLILPYPPSSIRFVKNSKELLKIINNSNKVFPENYNFLTNRKSYLITDFNEKDFQNFKINQPVLKATEFHSKIFENYLGYRNIKEYITITIRDKSQPNRGASSWNTDIDDAKLYINYIKENHLEKYPILLIPDTEKDVATEIVDLIKANNLKFFIFHHGSFSIPMRFLAYSKSNFNFFSTNGPCALLFFIKNNSYMILKDLAQGNNVQNFVKKLDKNIFLKRKFVFYEKYNQ